MVVDQITVDYSALESLAKQFLQAAEDTKSLHRTIDTHMQALEDGAWVSAGATVFYADMHDDLFPALQRLTQSLDSSSEVILQIVAVFQDAEEEAAGFFAAITIPGGIISLLKYGVKELLEELYQAGGKTILNSNAARRLIDNLATTFDGKFAKFFADNDVLSVLNKSLSKGLLKDVGSGTIGGVLDHLSEVIEGKSRIDDLGNLGEEVVSGVIQDVGFTVAAYGAAQIIPVAGQVILAVKAADVVVQTIGPVVADLIGEYGDDVFGLDNPQEAAQNYRELLKKISIDQHVDAFVEGAAEKISDVADDVRDFFGF